MTQAILAGFLIGIGDIALMTSSNHYIGAFLFSVALMSIIYFELPLYTGRIGFVIKEKTYAGCALALVFNTLGATLAVWLYTLMAHDNVLSTRYVADLKFNKGYLALFVAGILCNVLIHLAASTKHTIIVILCVMTFIISGFEHSIADVPYMILNFSWSSLLAWLCVLGGNTVGGIVTEWMLKFMSTNKEESPSESITPEQSMDNNMVFAEDIVGMGATLRDAIDGEYQQVEEEEEDKQ